MTKMDHLYIEELIREFATLRDEKRLLTSEVRKVSAKIFKKLPNDLTYVLTLCEQLLELRTWEMTITAYDWAHRKRNQYDESTFEVFEKWMKNYISDWWDCDDFCTHAFGELMIKYPHLLQRIVTWCDHENFAVRRCAPVILILPIKRKSLLTVDPLEIANRLYNDPHYLVLKGYGWMLKVLSSTQYDKVLGYLESNRSTMPRVAFRYALEKMQKSDKLRLMSE
ncbi:MAG: DNA alkylation repair protein [Erysipelotrichaceae bacterium]|nr:DNA alkylation repair protein [Erysipelotrichaceae bacterium]MDP3304935.1 DNA alkylation repair protein [Erysipelotrichaceae bacterium]